MRRINQAGVDLIKEFEGFEPAPYDCPAGVRTIGYGHVLLKGEEGLLLIDEEIGEVILRQDIMSFEREVDEMLRVPVTDNQFAALVSFAFNLGGGALRTSTLLKRLHAGDVEAAASWFGAWVYSKGKVLAGLRRRRAAERRLFLTPDAEEVVAV